MRGLRLRAKSAIVATAVVGVCWTLLGPSVQAAPHRGVGPTVKLTDDSPYYRGYFQGFRVEGHKSDYRTVFAHLYHGGSTDFEGEMLIDFTLYEETDNRDFIRMWIVSFFGSTAHYDLTTTEVIHHRVPDGVRVRNRCWHRDRGSYDC